jgi:anti-sigma regulatory factor (Ser/Thr protein kinase)
VIDLPSGQVGLAIGDVAGHGLRAGALMGQLRTGLRAYALEGHAPAETLKRLDRLLQTISGRGMATAAYAVIDPATGGLCYSSAGHPPPVLVRDGKEASLLGITTAPPLGTLPFAAYHEVQETLEPGDTVLLYTDGLVERRREPLTDGLERLRTLAAVRATADQLCQRVTEGLVPPEGGDDDIAVVALRIVPVEAAMSVRFGADPQVLAQMRRMLARWLQAHGAQPAEIGAIMLACGEACANAIEHAYAPGLAYFELEAVHADGLVTLTVRDTGRWRAPRGVHRGRGLKMIEAAIDELAVTTGEAGTEVVMRHRLGPR